MEADEKGIYIGDRWVWGGTQPFGLCRADRRHHLYIIGKTGAGKTTLLHNLVAQDIEAGRGVGVVDPHGDLAAGLLDLIPSRRVQDVAYFNAADAEHPVGLNLLDSRAVDTPSRIASGIVAIFKGIWGDSWGPRSEYILYASAAALAECPNTSLLGLPRMLVDEGYRQWVLRQVKDPVVRSFWLEEFAGYEESFRREAIAPIQNKVGQLLMSPVIRNIVGQVRSRIDARFMMDHGRIFIANLAKGSIGPDKADLLGAVLVTQFELAALQRAGIPEDQRRDFYLYIDEFQSFSTEAFAAILSEARKYRLCLTLSHQYISQVRPGIRDAVFGNVGTLVVFRVGQADARILAREFGDSYAPGHFSSLGNFEICVKLLAGGGQREPFTANTWPPRGAGYGLGQRVIRRSRQRYATPRQQVEERIGRWMRSHR